MPYKDARIRKDHRKRTYDLLKKKLTRVCHKCGVRECSFGATCKSCAKTGENHGITWARKAALVRDDYTCQICGLREIGVVEIDHILPVSKRPDLYTIVSNLITLCPNCHKRKTVRERNSQ